MNAAVVKATLRLFHTVLVDGKILRQDCCREVLERTVKNGYVIDQAVVPHEKLLDVVESVIGISGEKANAAFHKSWKVVADSPVEVLWVQQIVHYFSTYGMQELGLFDHDMVYVPCEKLEIPDVDVGSEIPLMVVMGMSSEEVKEAIVDLGCGVALGQETLSDVMVLVKDGLFDESLVGKIRNRELTTMLQEHYGMIPEDPVGFLRFVVNKLTGQSLLIKSDELIEAIKESDQVVLDSLLGDAPVDLASIFYRYKPLFLALKSVSDNKGFFNRLRKAAPKMHRPVREAFLDGVTARIKRGSLDLDRLRASLKDASVFRKVRLARALRNRLSSGNSIVYTVRNGRGWAAGFDWPSGLNGDTNGALKAVMDSVVEDVRSCVSGVKVFIPSHMGYELPATEKQFTGNFPSGTSVEVEDDLVVGVHWTNVDYRCVDLDLSVMSAKGKIGWDSSYRSDDCSVLFSGDLTDAPGPNGASELFYIDGGVSVPMILMLNYYNYSADVDVEAKIVVGRQKANSGSRTNYVIDPNNIVATAGIIVNKKQNVLGIVAAQNGKNRVFFSHMSVGRSITSTNGVNAVRTRKFLVRSMLCPMDFRGVLSRAGVVLTAGRDDADVDLSPECLEKSTFLSLMTGVG